MKKFKLLLTLAVVAILAAGVLVGCSSQFELDPNETPHKVTYCANGGLIENRAELYYYYPDEGLILTPTTDGDVENAVRVGYTLLGWAKADVDASGNPVLLDEPLYPNDGGVWVTEDGAITESQFAEMDKIGNTYTKKYYSYDVNDLFEFKGTYVTEHLVLVAVWGVYNQYVVVDKDAEGNWVDFSELYAVEDGVVTDKVTEDEAILAKYTNNLTKISNATGVISSRDGLDDSYDALGREGYTLIRYYLDEECAVELTFPYTATKPLTPIYYTEIEGDYTLVSSYSEFRDAVRADENIYLMKDVDFANKGVDNNGSTYTSILQGNGKKLLNVSVVIEQTQCKEGAANVYGGLFGTLDGATVKDVEINITVNFEIGVNPNDNDPSTALDDIGTERDAVCYVGVFAGALIGEYSISGVTVNATCMESRSVVNGDRVYNPEKNRWEYEQVPNSYEVEVFFADWQGIEGAESDDKIVNSTVNRPEASN